MHGIYNKHGNSIFSLILKIVSLTFFLFTYSFTYSQEVPVDSLKVDSLRIKSGKAAPTENSGTQYDVSDLAKDIFNRNKIADPARKRSGITVIPNIAANPTIG